MALVLFETMASIIIRVCCALRLRAAVIIVPYETLEQQHLQKLSHETQRYTQCSELCVLYTCKAISYALCAAELAAEWLLRL
jgi:hypothetical protein